MPAVPALWRLKTPASLEGDAAAARSAVVVSIDADAAPLLDSDASDGKDGCWRRYFCRLGYKCMGAWCITILLLIGVAALVTYLVLCSLSGMVVKEYGGYTFHIADGDEIPDIIKRNTDRLNACIEKRGQPIIVLHASDESFYGGWSFCEDRIYMNMNTNHESLFVHEYVHYLDDVKWGYNLPCVSDLFSELEYRSLEWGSPPGFPYCYGNTGTLPNRYEYIATLMEGYCTDECGPTRDYLTDTSNPIAVEQLACVHEFLG